MSLLPVLGDSREVLVRETETLLQLVAAGAADDAITAATRRLEPALAYLNSWRTKVEQCAAELSSCADVFTKVQGSEGTLRELVSLLTHVQTMFRIESAGLPEGVREVFAGLSLKIANVHQDVTSTFGEQFRTVAGTLSSLEEVRSTMHRQTHAIAGALKQHDERAAAALLRLKAEIARNAGHEAEVSDAQKQIGHAVTNIVMALQVDDIVSQRLEAVETSLGQAQDQLTGAEPNGAQAWCNVAIQKGQIAGIRKQIVEAESALESAAEEIMARVKALNGEDVLLKDFEEVTAASNGSAEVSLSMTAEVSKLLGGVVECSRTFYQSMAPLSAITKSLAGALDRVSNQMKLIALNAQVQAVQIGAGTGLEVLAAHTASVSVSTSALAGEISAGIERVTGVVQQLMHSFSAIIEAGETACEGLRVEASAYEHSVQTQKDSTLQRLRSIAAAMGQINGCATCLAGEATERRAGLAALDEIRASLEASEEVLKATYGHSEAKTGDEMAGAGRYRMQAQRDIHKAVMKSLDGGAQTETAAEQFAAAEEIESEVELF